MKKKKDLMSETKKYFDELKIGTKNMFLEFCNKKTRKKQIPNIITFIRLLIPIIVVILATLATTFNITSLFISAGILTIIGGSTDWIDGFIAKKTKTTSEYGKKLDQITDKVFSILISVNLCTLNPIFIVPIIGELVIGIINLYYKINYTNLEHNSILIGRIKEWPLFLALGIGYFCPISSYCINLLNSLIPIVLSFQIVTASSYIALNTCEIVNKKSQEKEFNKEFDNNEIEFNFEKEKFKTINNKIEQYTKLRNVLLEVVKKNQNSKNNIIFEEDNINLEKTYKKKIY